MASRPPAILRNRRHPLRSIHRRYNNANPTVGITNKQVSLVKMANPTCEVLSQYAESLSGGNQQKVIIAREVSNDPEVLIASQPTRGLDVGAIILLVAGFNPLEA